jgi:Putative DNA-binding domain
MNEVSRTPAFGRSLGAQQRWLFERVTERAPGAGEARDRAITLDAAGWVRGGRVPAGERIEVYRRGYFARLVECLADDYPAVEQALGASNFEALCLDFIDAHPPPSASLNYYGAPFAEFIASGAAPNATWVSELGRLEWAVVEAIHADAEAVLDPTALGALQEADWARARLLASPALRVLCTRYPVHRYYRAFLEGNEPALPDLEPSVIAVCRRGNDVWRLSVAAPFATLLGHLVAGMPLASALEAVSSVELGGQASGDELLRVFSEWVACGFFAAIAID